MEKQDKNDLTNLSMDMRIHYLNKQRENKKSGLSSLTHNKKTESNMESFSNDEKETQSLVDENIVEEEFSENDLDDKKANMSGDDESYIWEKTEAFVELGSRIPEFFKHGINTKKFLEEQENKRLDEEAEKITDRSFDGEIQYDDSFENDTIDFGNYTMTYRELYEELRPEIEDRLLDTEAGRDLRYKNIVETNRDINDFTNIIFSIIKAMLEAKEVNYDNIIDTTNYLNVPVIKVSGVCSKKGFKDVIAFSEDIYNKYFHYLNKQEDLEDSSEDITKIDETFNISEKITSSKEENSINQFRLYDEEKSNDDQLVDNDKDEYTPLDMSKPLKTNLSNGEVKGTPVLSGTNTESIDIASQNELYEKDDYTPLDMSKPLKTNLSNGEVKGTPVLSGTNTESIDIASQNELYEKDEYTPLDMSRPLETNPSNGEVKGTPILSGINTESIDFANQNNLNKENKINPNNNSPKREIFDFEDIKPVEEELEFVNEDSIETEDNLDLEIQEEQQNSFDLELLDNETNIYQDIFKQYGSIVYKDENGEDVLYNASEDVYTSDYNLVKKHRIACLWHCVITRYYNKQELSLEDWNKLEELLEEFKRNQNLKAQDRFMQSALKVGFTKDFIENFIEVKEYLDIFDKYVSDNVVSDIQNKY